MYLCVCVRARAWGVYNTWTVDAGLDHGLDSGLHNVLRKLAHIYIFSKAWVTRTSDFFVSQTER